MVAGLDQMEGITFHDLYEEYPDFDIDVKREQDLMENHDVILFQFPFFLRFGSGRRICLRAPLLCFTKWRDDRRSLQPNDCIGSHFYGSFSSYHAYQWKTDPAQLWHQRANRKGSRHHERSSFIQQVRKDIAELELRMVDDMDNEGSRKDLRWDTDTIKKEYAPMVEAAEKDQKD